MTARWPFRVQAALLLILASLIGAMGFVFLEQYHQANEQSLLKTALTAQSVAWKAVQNQRRLLAENVFREHVEAPEVLTYLEWAQDPKQRDLARVQLYQHLEQVYQRLQFKGFEQFQFHLPSGESLLRMHHPQRFGDSLLDLRTGVARVNREGTPISGFEIGRAATGYRYLFPIFSQSGQHLGSVEFSVPLTVLAQELRLLLPGREFEVLLLAEHVDRVIFPELRSQFRPWRGSARFWVETPSSALATHLPALSASVQGFVAQLDESPQLRFLAESDDEEAVRVWINGQDYIMIRSPIRDPDGDVLGMLMSYAPEQAFAAIDQGYRMTVGLAALLFFTVLMGLALAFFAAANRAADRRQLQLITDTLGEGLYVTDARGVLTFINPCAAELLGGLPESFLGQVAHDAFHRHPGNRFLDTSQCPITTMVSLGRTYRGEQQFQRLDGTLLDVRITSRPIMYRESFGGSVTVFQDITQEKAGLMERERIQTALERRTAELAQSNAELEQFAYAVSHDLRQPLRLVGSYVQLLERRLAAVLEPETQKMMDFARDAAQRMDQMLVSLLQYSRVGRLGEPRQAMDTHSALEEALRFLGPTIEASNAEITVTGNWPILSVSRDEFTRLLQNLLDNALKYQKAGETPRIRVGAQERADGFEFCVADNGIGIAENQVSRLFEVFQRLHTREAYEGTGVGLAICRKVVERHGGRIWVDSAGEGAGSQFCFWLPGQNARVEAGAEQGTDPGGQEGR